MDSYGAFSGGRRNKDYPHHVRVKLRKARQAATARRQRKARRR